MNPLKSRDPSQISIIQEKIMRYLKTQGLSSYDSLQERCNCNRGDFAIAMRHLLRQGSIIRDKQQGEYKIT